MVPPYYCFFQILETSFGAEALKWVASTIAQSILDICPMWAQMKKWGQSSPRAKFRAITDVAGWVTRYHPGQIILVQRKDCFVVFSCIFRHRKLQFCFVWSWDCCGQDCFDLVHKIQRQFWRNVRKWSSVTDQMGSYLRNWSTVTVQICSYL